MDSGIENMMKTLHKPVDSELSLKDLESVTGGVSYGDDIDWDNFGIQIDWDNIIPDHKIENPDSKPYKGGLSRSR